MPAAIAISKNSVGTISTRKCRRAALNAGLEVKKFTFEICTFFNCSPCKAAVSALIDIKLKYIHLKVQGTEIQAIFPVDTLKASLL